MKPVLEILRVELCQRIALSLKNGDILSSHLSTDENIYLYLILKSLSHQIRFMYLDDKSLLFGNKFYIYNWTPHLIIII